MVPEGRLHMRPFQFHLKKLWRYPQSLDSLLPWTETISAHLEWWQNPTNMMKGAFQRPQYPTLYRHLKRRLGCSLRANLYKREKRLHINVLELKAVSLALQRFKDQCQYQTVLVGTGNSTAVAYINKPTWRRCTLSCGRS